MILNVVCEDSTLEVQIQEETTVLDVKKAVSEKLGIPSKFQHLVYYDKGTKVRLPTAGFVRDFIDSDTKVYLEKKSTSASRGVPGEEVNRYVLTAVTACSENNVEKLYSALKSYEKTLAVALKIEDVGRILNTLYQGKWACIHYACFMGNKTILKELLELGAQVNIETNDCWTPLQVTCFQGQLECCKVLLDHPLIQINKSTKQRGTGLHLAAQQGFVEIIELLLSYGADLNIEDQDQKIPIELSCSAEVMETLGKAAGQMMLEKYGNLSPPLPFSGELWYTSSLQIADKKVFLVLDVDSAKLNHYKERTDFLNSEPPNISVPFNNIEDLRRWRDGDKHFFGVKSKEQQLDYYTEFGDMTNEWTKRIIEIVNYYQIFKNNRENKLKEPEDNYEIVEEFSESHEGDLSIDDFTIEKEIGSGSFGKVYKITKNDSGNTYALKSLRKPALIRKDQLKYAIGECKILKLISHPFIVRLHWALQTASELCFVLEYCPNGDLSQVLARKKLFPEPVAKFYLCEIILAIEHLHNYDIVFRDLKPQNLLLDAEGHIKLADFGLAKENVTERNLAMSFVGSPAYLAPEVLKSEGASKSMDIYCIATNFYEMLTGEPPFYTDDISLLYRRISLGGISFPEFVSEPARVFTEWLMNKDPKKRPKVDEIKRSSYLSDVDWNSVLQKVNKPDLEFLGIL